MKKKLRTLGEGQYSRAQSNKNRGYAQLERNGSYFETEVFLRRELDVGKTQIKKFYGRFPDWRKEYEKRKYP